MSPPSGIQVGRVGQRKAPTQDDETAERFLRAAAQLIDLYLAPRPNTRLPRLRSIRFPAALDWLRTSDVIRAAAAESSAGTSRKAFMTRWPTKELFLRDALVYALIHEKDAGVDTRDPATTLSGLDGGSVADAIAAVASGMIRTLTQQPRSYLITHIACLLPQHKELWEAVLPVIRETHLEWAGRYAEVIDRTGVVLRPGWTPLRLQQSMQAMLDGFLIRYRLQPDDYAAEPELEIFGSAVLAFLVGVIDQERTGESERAALDRLMTEG